ncbi:sporulation protein YqfD [bacterium C-53]|nr:sporulation protein YqfD [Lachnospiraceae bacterium]NBI01929.1 sporulation protein YqfD [Lachnospiraceae bacterium]RKJ12330.1 sporulation protein YqfD [bacterium C-53]
MNRIIIWLKGYVKVRLSGFSPERFMNLCGNRSIHVWGVENHGRFYILYMSRKSFLQLRPVIRKTKTKVAIIEKYGLPFFMHRYRKRKLFFAGILVFLMILLVMSLYIWDIRISGNYSKTSDMILKLLSDNNYKYGMRKSKVDCEAIEKLIRAEYNDVTWASARIDGTCLIVELKENEILRQEETVEKPSDLIAEREGEVVAIVTRAGSPKVRKGDMVSANQILVSGAVPVLDDFKTLVGMQYVKADADIYLKTRLPYEYSLPFLHTEKEYTGKKRYDGSISLFSKNLKFHIFDNPFPEFDRVEDTKQIRLSEYFTLPVTVTLRTTSEYRTVKKKYTKEEAAALCKENLKKFLDDLEEKGVQIIENDVKIGIVGENCLAKGMVDVILLMEKRQDTEMVTVTVPEDNRETEE